MNELPLSLSSRQDIEDLITENAKQRRFTVRRLQEMFVELCRDWQVEGIIECGANDGRHTQNFLRSTAAKVWAFEASPVPAVELLRRVDERLTSVLVALSDSTRVVEFTQPLSATGEPINGIASLSLRTDESISAVTYQVCAMRFDEYVSGILNPPRSWGAWIDVEGNADRVLEGFGQVLRSVDVALIEVETRPWWSREPSAEVVMRQLQESGLRVVARDWMTAGQHNVLAVSERQPTPQSVLEYNATVTEWIASCLDHNL